MEPHPSYKVETHAHTSEVSPCGRLGARDLARAYHQAGYQCLIITDHYRSDIYHNGGRTIPERLARFWRGYELASQEGRKLGLTVLPGMEIGFDGSWSDHLLYGITPEFLLEQPEIFALGIQAFYPLAREHGITVIQAHPFRQGVTLSPADCLDGMETWNANMSATENRLARDFAARHGLLMTAGSDCHADSHVAKSGLVLPRPVHCFKDLTDQLRHDEACHLGTDGTNR